MQPLRYDYIIAGGGMAGLSLAYYLAKSPVSIGKTILIIDREDKILNDRTWCYWQNTPNAFESIVFRQWPSVWFGDEAGQLRELAIAPYTYSLLRSVDFYAFVRAQLATHAGISWQKTTIHSITSVEQEGIVSTAAGVFAGSYVFDSITPLDLSTPYRHHLLQHFKGYVLETPSPQFDPAKAILMDFRIPQAGDCRFMYVLPFSPTKALVEYTIFNETLLPPTSYDEALQNYLHHHLQLTDYKVTETEYGVIPMSDTPTEEFPTNRHIRIGTAGGYTHPATGYTFAHTQERLQLLVKQLEQHGKPHYRRSRWQGRHLLYASILLNVLHHRRFSAAQFFDRLYRRNPPARVFKFLAMHTKLAEELRLMSTTPIPIFIKATIDVARKRVREWIEN